MFTIKYDDYLGVTINCNESEQINDKFLYFTPYYHPPSFDMIERKGMCRNYRGKHSERNKHVRVCNICDEVRCRSWRVSLNILLEGIPNSKFVIYIY